MQVLPAPDHVTILTAPQPATALCPGCGWPSQRVHSRYKRTLGDLPWQRRPVTLRVQARRFRCLTPSCSRQTFSDQVTDRWHLLRNLGTAVQALADRHSAAARRAARQVTDELADAAAVMPQPPSPARAPTAAQRASEASSARRQARYEDAALARYDVANLGRDGGNGPGPRP